MRCRPLGGGWHRPARAPMHAPLRASGLLIPTGLVWVAVPWRWPATRRNLSNRDAQVRLGTGPLTCFTRSWTAVGAWLGSPRHRPWTPGDPRASWLLTPHGAAFPRPRRRPVLTSPRLDPCVASVCVLRTRTMGRFGPALATLPPPIVGLISSAALQPGQAAEGRDTPQEHGADRGPLDSPPGPGKPAASPGALQRPTGGGPGAEPEGGAP